MAIQVGIAGRSRGLATAGDWRTSSDAAVLLVAIPIAAAIVLAMAAGLRSLETVAAFAAILVAVVSPAVGLAVLAFMATLQSPGGIPAPGFASMMVGAMLIGCVYRLPLERPRPRANAPLLLLSAFVLFVTVQQSPEMAAGYSGQQAHAVGYLFFQLLTAFGFVVAAIWLLADRSPYPALAMGIAGASVAAAIALVPYLLPAFGAPFANLSGHSEDLTRASGPFSNPNFMGASMAMAFAATVAMVVISRGPRIRSVLILVAIALGGAILISLSRGALVAAVAGVAWLALSRSRTTAVAVLVIGLVGAFVIYPAFVEWRLVNLTGSASPAALEIMERSDEGRLSGVLAGVPLFLSSPVAGVGFGQYLASSVRVTGGDTAVAAHNWYMNVLAEQGIVGIVLWFLFLVALARQLMDRPSHPRSVGLAVLSAFAAACLFLEAPTSFQTVALPSLLLIAALAAKWQPAKDDQGDDSMIASATQKHPGGT